MDCCCLCGLKVTSVEQLEAHIDTDHSNIYVLEPEDTKQPQSTQESNINGSQPSSFSTNSDQLPDSGAKTNEHLMANQGIQTKVNGGQSSTFQTNNLSESGVYGNEDFMISQTMPFEVNAMAMQSHFQGPSQPTYLDLNKNQEPLVPKKQVNNDSFNNAVLKTPRLRRGLKKCSSCAYTTESNRDLMQHQIQTHIALHLYSAYDPGQLNQQIFKIKQEENYNKLKNKNPDKRSSPKFCEKCNKHFKNGKALSGHKWKLHTDHGVLSCNICPQTFSSHNSFYSHKQKVHEGPKWSCEDCQKGFYSKYGLQIHIASRHSGNKKQNCRICLKEKVVRAFNENHAIVNVNNEKEYVCLTCVKHSERPIQERLLCKICNRDYKNISTLKLHNFEVHVMNRHFPCQLCNKIYTCQSAVRGHKTIFHGTKKWRCETCGRDFSQKLHLKKHGISIHSQNNKGFCFQCQKILSFNLFAKKNMKIVDGLKVSICYSCSKSNNQIIVETTDF